MQGYGTVSIIYEADLFQVRTLLQQSIKVSRSRHC